MTLDQYETRLRLLPCVVGWMTSGEQTSRGEPIGPCRCDELHHAGDATDRDDWNQIPICRTHHQGPLGIHPSRRMFEMRNKGLTEIRLVAGTRRMYALVFGI
jgi:hypothetical protein